MTETATPIPVLSRLAKFLPVILFLVAFLIRLPGIGWGLKNDLHNQSYHPDETVVWAYSQQIEPAKFKFTPGFYNYGTLYLTGLRVVSDVTAAYTGGLDPASAEKTWAFVSRVHLAARFLSVLAGAGTVLAVFFMLRRRLGDFAATMGALLLAVAPGHVMHSRFQTVDVVATLFLTLSMLFALKLLDEADPKAILKAGLLSGAFAGLSAGTKYTGILALLTLGVVVAIRLREKPSEEAESLPKATFLKSLLAAIGTALAVFVLVTPGVVLENEAFMRDLRYEMAHTATGHGLEFVGTSGGFAFHLSNLMLGVGALLTLLGIGGLVVGISRRDPLLLALGSFFVVYFVLIGRAEVAFLRYTFPLLIGLAAGFGALMAQANRRGGIGKLAVVLGMFALAGVDSRGLIGTVQETVAMTGEDSRDRAAREIRNSGAASVGLARDPWFWSVPFFPDSTAMRAMPLAARLQESQQSAKPPLLLAVRPNEQGKPVLEDFDPTVLTTLKPDRIAMTALEFDAHERLIGRTDIPADAQSAATKYRDFMKLMGASYELEKQFGTASRVVEDMKYVDPVVLIWKRKPTP